MSHVKALACVTLAALSLAPAAAAGQVQFTVFGQVSALNPAPTSGPFAGSHVGDAVELRLLLAVPGIQHPTLTQAGYRASTPPSVLAVGAVTAGLDPAGVPTVGVYENYLGLRDLITFYNEPLIGGGLVRFDLIDATNTLLDTTDLLLLRGAYPAASFTTTSFGAQVGGGFLEFTFDRVEIGHDGLGAVYCAPAVPNSTGHAGLMQVTGSAVLAANNLTLEARRLPLNTFGFFLASTTQAQVLNPGGSQGTLCLGGSIGRYQAQVQNSGPSGFIALAASPMSLPQPNGAVAAQVGETWNFQAWFRDANPVNTSNFTDAIAVTFE